MSEPPHDEPETSDGSAPKAPDPASMTGRELQENPSQGPIDTPPGSDADHAAEVPHVG